MVLAQMACCVTQNLHVFSGSDKKAPTARTAQLVVAQCISSCSAGTPRRAGRPPRGFVAGVSFGVEVTVERLMLVQPHAGPPCICRRVKATAKQSLLCRRITPVMRRRPHCGPPVNFAGILNGALQALSPWEAERPAERSCRYRSCFSSVNLSRCGGGVSHTRATIRSFTHQKHTSQLSVKSGMRFSASDSSVNLAGNIYFKFHFHFLFFYFCFCSRRRFKSACQFD